MSTQEKDAIASNLLKIRSGGKPPFLVRNLRYVQACKDLAKKRVWDLSWTEPNYRSAQGGRHLVLKVCPSRCILAESVTSYLLNLNNPLPRPNIGVAYRPHAATLRVTLHVRQRDDHVVSFSTRSVRIRVWPKEHQHTFEQYDYELEDFPITETFDLSAVLPLLGTKPASLSLTVELWDSEMRSRSTVTPVLLGEVLIWDCETSKHGSAIPNASVKIPLGFAYGGSNNPPNELVAQSVSAPVVSLEDKVMRRFEYMGIGRRQRVKKDNAEPSKQQEEDIENGSAGSILLKLTGSVEKAITQALEEDKPHISVQLKYKSPESAWWNGIVRNDFICPWCHRNCHRYRALLAHFQVEHDEMKFAIQGASQSDGEYQKGNRMPFTLEFTVKRLSRVVPDSNNGTRGRRTETSRRASNSLNETSEQYYDYIYANPRRFGSYMMTMNRNVQSRSDKSEQNDSSESEEKSETGRTTSLNPVEDEAFLSFVHKQLGNNCKVCFRHHNKEYNGRSDFCSEWCEIVYRKKEKEADSSSDTDEEIAPLQSFASVPRQKRINYKETMGNLKLYHVVSVHEANVDLFEDDDPDSEEEVDQKWRMDLSLEAVRYLDDVSPKEKALWLMWNKFSHEEYPLPSFYGERYSRYTLELFALSYSSQIKQFKLRLAFFGFLRAMHRHGLVDCVAIKSIMHCLDGKKRRRDLQISARPELPHRSLDMNGRRGSKLRTARPSSSREVTEDPSK